MTPSKPPSVIANRRIARIRPAVCYNFVMISDPHVARQVLDVAFRASSELDRSIHLVIDGAASDAEVTAYKRAVGRVMAEIYDGLLNPLLRSHPQFVPKEWRDWFPTA